MRGSLIIVGFFVLGIVCGVMHWLPDLNAWGNVSFWTLCALLFCVGVTVGNNTALLKSFRQLDPRLMLLPLIAGLWYRERVGNFLITIALTGALGRIKGITAKAAYATV